MYRILKVALLLLIFQHAVAGEILPKVDGEVFGKRYIGKPGNGQFLVEFVRENESFESWTKLIGYRYQQLPGIDNDPFKYASAMFRMAQGQDPRANPQILKNEQSNQAVVDYIIHAPDGKFVEHNVFRFWKSQDGKAIVSLQIARRFDPPNPIVEELERPGMKVGERRFSWIVQATELFKPTDVEAELLRQ